jgi:hypothetical protein
MQHDLFRKTGSGADEVRDSRAAFAARLQQLPCAPALRRAAFLTFQTIGSKFLL